MSVGERLRNWRIENDLTTTQIHNEIGISVGALSNYETDKREVSSELLIQLHEKFGLDIVYILTGVKDEKRLSDEQEQVLHYFDQCDLETKNLIIEILKRFSINSNDSSIC